MYSAKLNLSLFKQLKRLTKLKSIKNLIDEVYDYFNTFDLSPDFTVLENCETSFINLVNKLIKRLDKLLTSNKPIENKKEITLVYFELYHFIKIHSFYNENFKTIITKSKDDIEVSINCLDASDFILDTLQNKAKASILFSATLQPIQYYRKLLSKGVGREVTILSPFEQTHLGLYVNSNISTRYKDRQNSINTIIETINIMINQKPGNYIVFFPSYAYLNQVKDVFESIHNDVYILTQTPNMSERMRHKFIKQFKKKETTLAFFIMGGLFSEGIDYAHDMLDGVLIVGVGLPQYGNYNNLLKEHFDKKFRNGFDYAYTYPGFNKVVQAVGRVIRTTTDKGIAILLDDRFNQYKYKKLFPKEWSHYKLTNDSTTLKNTLNEFWITTTKKST